MSQIKLAEAQLIGFAHASKGFGIKELADSMALTKREWLKLRDSINLKALDKEDLNEKYGVK
jgi:hypothetical protein